MGNLLNCDKGIKLLIQKCRREFRQKENKDFYTEADYKAAERKFVKYYLLNKTRIQSKLNFHQKSGLNKCRQLHEPAGPLVLTAAIIYFSIDLIAAVFPGMAGRVCSPGP